ncbi:MAG: hypothetical protein AAF845_17200, partial [Bacteroidota bacterium]
MRVFFLALTLLLALPASGQTRYEWVGGSSGDWTEAANWSPNGVPAASDTAVVASGGIVVARLTENTTVAGLEVTGLGVVAGDFDLTVTERVLWAGGGAGFETFRGTGTITVASGATLHMAEGTSRYQMTAGRTLVNDGTILWDGTGVWQGRGRLVNNGEVILAMRDVDFIAFSDVTDAITNTSSGVIRRDGPDAVRISSGMVNDGRIRVASGALNFNGFNAVGITGTGSIEVESGAELILSGSPNSTQASITGETVTVSSFNGRTIVTDTYDVTTTRIVGSAGRLRLDADATTEDLVMEGGALEGSGTVTVTGSLDWNGGRMEGSGTTTLGPTIPLTISGTSTLRLGGTRTLRTEGPVTWTGDADLQTSSGTTVFESAGTLTSSGPGERLCNTAFRNTGTLVHDGGSLRFNAPMDNAGTVRILDGLILKNGTNGVGGTDSGRTEIAETGRLEYNFSAWTWTEDAEVVGTGTVAFTAGTVTNRATWRPGASPGTLTIDSDLPAPAPEAVFDLEIGGPEAGTDFDQIAVTGEAALGGTLKVTLTDGFTPSDGDRFLIVAASGGATGVFDALDLPDGLEAFVDVTEAGADLVIG